MDYIFGYGSLIEQASRLRTTPNATLAYPVIVSGVARCWEVQQNVPSFTTTFLGARLNDAARCNGVIYYVDVDDLQSTDAREIGYIRQRILPSQVKFINENEEAPMGNIWVYVTAGESKPPTPMAPIVQSYVDMCLNGCLEFEADYPQAKAMGFAKLFLDLTVGWNSHWGER